MERYKMLQESICRVCVRVVDPKTMVPLIDKTKPEGLSHYGKAAVICANISLKSDILPQNMCQDCFVLLKAAFAFKKKCEISNQKLIKFIQNLHQSLKKQEVNIPSEDSKGCSGSVSKIETPIKMDATIKIEIESDNEPDDNNQTENSGEIDLANYVHVRIETALDSMVANDYILDRMDEISDATDDDDEIHKYVTEKDNNAVDFAEIDKCIDNEIKEKAQNDLAKAVNINCNYKKKRLRQNDFIIVEENISGNKRKVQCNVCNKIVKYTSFKVHLESHGTDKRFICEICAISFTTRALLDYHRVHKHGIGPYIVCDYCGSKFYCKTDLTKHIHSHTGERPYTCETCGMTFRQKFSWKNHILKHKEKTVQCPDCPKKFYAKYQLTDHANRHHHRRFVYACNLCSKTAFTIEAIKQHTAKVHGVPKVVQGKVRRVFL